VQNKDKTNQLNTQLKELSGELTKPVEKPTKEQKPVKSKVKNHCITY
jgi:hypothetical protein